MTWIEALLLGIIQGLTEFLPISSSGHIALANYFLGLELSGEEALAYTVLLHFATALSTIMVLHQNIFDFFRPEKDRTTFKERHMGVKVLLSTLPAGILGLLFQHELSHFFSGNIGYTIFFLLVTAILLFLADSQKGNVKGLGFGSAMVMGLAQAFALLPGISRSGSTIAFGALWGVKKDLATRFSFIMVLPLILGKIILDCISGDISFDDVDGWSLSIGFLAAFITGLLACKFMLTIVRRGKLKYFSLYCILVVVGFLVYRLFAPA